VLSLGVVQARIRMPLTVAVVPVFQLKAIFVLLLGRDDPKVALRIVSKPKAPLVEVPKTAGVGVTTGVLVGVGVGAGVGVGLLGVGVGLGTGVGVGVPVGTGVGVLPGAGVGDIDAVV